MFGIDNGLCMMNAPVNGLSSFSPHTVRALGGISFLTIRSAHIAMGLLGRFSVGGRVLTCCRRGGGRGNGIVVSHVLGNRDYTVMSSTKVPTVSSPNRSLIHMTCRGNVRILTIPKPDTLVATLDVSKVPDKQFYFRNFLAVGGVKHHRRLRRLGGRAHAVVFCRTPRGLSNALSSVLGCFNSHGITVMHRLAGLRRDIDRAALDRTLGCCARGAPHNRFMLVISKGPGSRPICALRSTRGVTGGLVRSNVSASVTSGRTTAVANVGGNRVCGVLLWEDEGGKEGGEF